MRSAQNPIEFGSTDLSGDLTSQIVGIIEDYGFCIQIAWTGPLNGTFQLQASCDKGNYLANGIQGVNNWSDVPAGTIVAAGSDGSGVINADAQYYRWFRVVWTNASGTGTLTVAQLNVKGP